MKKTGIGRIACGIIALALVVSIIFSCIISVYADQSKIITLGADLSQEQRDLILNYLGVNESEVEIITITNADEHQYLDNIASQAEIGKHTYSCCYIEPTNEGGIHIKTVNINWATCDMIRNAMITSGITNANVICVSPIQVSGTGSLTGIFKAYEGQLSDDRVEVASEELITTLDIATEIGQDEASSMLEELKEEVISGEVDNNEDAILDAINKYIDEHNIKLTEERKLKIAQILLKIAGYEYDLDEIKKSYDDIKSTISDIKQKTEEAKGILDKIIDFFVTLWQKITGTYEKVQATEEYQQVKDRLGIILETNDELLGSNTVVTNTEDERYIESISETQDESIATTENSDANIEEKEDRWFTKVIKKLFNGDEQEESIVDNNEITDINDNKDQVTFESFSNIQEETKDMDETEQKDTINNNMLDIVKFEYQENPYGTNDNDANAEKTNTENISFDELTGN